MVKHETKYCPKCNKEFECKVGSISLCQCTTVNLTTEERQFIQSKYDDCLCANCMKDLKTTFHNQQFNNKLKRILGVHYKQEK